ncbi:putative Glycosyltransferase family 92 [Medicago truncatula]|uniref:Glycosyltransferase family 92 protein n=1 Tax=Medicago truncatula TaxID=3880 RepID=A0A072VGR7_MEDTR|nr:galactan beta-1,4-galactosyltransferase GALS3 [Medicago truncatula]KEH37330.1 glycosyltransferase family 92 protein [Medicago truncatula]RHN73257.1 putative Glycosyltransferase family 92 [Medicago truncatula]
MAKEREKKLFTTLFGSYAAELKLLITTLLLLCTVATFLQFIPSRFTISASDLRFCISRVSTSQTLLNTTTNTNTNTNNLTVTEKLSTVTSTPPPNLPPPPPSPPLVQTEHVTENGIIKRAFNPYGSAAYNFITMGAYRGGLNTFAIIGIASKPLHLYSKPTYECEWISDTDADTNVGVRDPVTTVGYKILPDWGYGRVYTVVIVNCTFPKPLNTDNSGGKLILNAATSGGGDTSLNITDRIEALTEPKNSVDFNIFTSKPKYDYFYCGSSLYGNLNPQRVREWIAYHVKFFGPSSHFVIHDAGGVHEEVYEVLKPWIELGYVTLQDIRDQERFDGYYHNQFMVVNDCLHRYKFMAKWMFFFDVDEYIYVPPKSTIKSVLDSLSEYNQFTIEQMPMNAKLCHSADYGKTYRKWGIEKLVYKDVKKGIRRDRKYAVQPRSLFATGVHMSQNLDGKTTHKTEGRIKYFHYHGTIAQRRESCKMFLNSTATTYDKTPYELDTTLRDLAGVIKKFEQKMIGNKVQKTRL